MAGREAGRRKVALVTTLAAVAGAVAVGGISVALAAGDNRNGTAADTTTTTGDTGSAGTGNGTSNSPGSSGYDNPSGSSQGQLQPPVTSPQSGSGHRSHSRSGSS
jgi:hypothetical protein